MTTARAMPCPDCCNPDDPCAVGTYDFATFATGTTVGEGFVEDSGDWTIDDDGGSSDPQLWCDGPQTDAQIRQGTDQFTNGIGSVAVTFTSFDNDPAGTTFRIIGAYTDDDNFLAARVARVLGGFTFALIERSGGTDTTLASTTLGTLAGVADFTVSLCWNGTEARAHFSEGDIAISGSTTLTGNYSAIRATLGATTLRITDWGMTHNSAIHADCVACLPSDPEPGECVGCSELVLDFDILVSISGLEDADDCQDCGDLDGDYLTTPGEGQAIPLEACIFAYQGTVDLCGESRQFGVTVQIFPADGTIPGLEFDAGIYVSITFGDSSLAQFFYPNTGTVECMTFLDGLVIPFVFDHFDTGSGPHNCPPEDYATVCDPELTCSGRNATVTLTIVP